MTNVTTTVLRHVDLSFAKDLGEDDTGMCGLYDALVEDLGLIYGEGWECLYGGTSTWSICGIRVYASALHVLADVTAQVEEHLS